MPWYINFVYHLCTCIVELIKHKRKHLFQQGCVDSTMKISVNSPVAAHLTLIS